MKPFEILPGYVIYSNGRIKKKSTKTFLKNSLHHTGYYEVSLRIEGKRKHFLVHRLVALAFLPNPENKPLVNHKDGNKRNCKVKNLEWATHQENSKHAYETGLSPKGERRFGSKLDFKKVQKIKKLVADKVPNSEIARLFSVSASTVGRIKNNENWRHVRISLKEAA